MFAVGNLIAALASILDLALTIYMWVIIARALLSWVNPDPYNPIVRMLYNVTEPVLAWVRSRVPVVFGGLDLAPLVCCWPSSSCNAFWLLPCLNWPAGSAKGGFRRPMSPFFQPTGQGYLLRLTVVPGAQRTQVVGLYGDRLKIRLAAPPEKGAANRELIDFLARALDLPETFPQAHCGCPEPVQSGGGVRPVPGPERPTRSPGAPLLRMPGFAPNTSGSSLTRLVG